MVRGFLHNGYGGGCTNVASPIVMWLTNYGIASKCEYYLLKQIQMLTWIQR